MSKLELSSKSLALERRLRQRLFWLGLVMVLLAGAILRIFKISRYPPGLHYDEAVNFIVAREIAFYGARPFPVFAAFNGREVLHFYLEACAMLGLGQHIFTLHVVNIFVNLVTLAATIGLGTAMFGKSRGLILGILAGAVMAVSFPQIFIARQVFRAASLPLMQGLALWTLFVGLQSHRKLQRWVWLAAAGIFGGLALYTYMASRLFPVWLGLILVALFVLDRGRRWQRFKQAALVMAVLVMVALPILHYYYENQAVFEDRLSQLSGAEDSISYTESAWLHLKMFFVQGDPYMRYNEAFAAYFDPITGILLVVGLLISVGRIFREQDALRRTAYFAVALSPLMVIPSVLAVGGLPPSHMRSIGMVPLIFFLPAIGADGVWRGLDGYLSTNRRTRNTIAAFVFTGLLLGSSLWVWGRYERWASSPELFYMTDSDMVGAGAWLQEHRGKDTLMYVTSLHYDHPSLRMYELPGDDITFLLGERLFLPPVNRAAYLIETHNAPLSPLLRAVAQANFEVENGPDAPDGQPSFVIYRWAGTELIENSRPLESQAESVGNVLRFLSADAPSGVAGESLHFLSQWLILNPPNEADLTPVFQLQTLDGDVLAQQDPFTLYSNLWRRGEVLVQEVAFDIPIGTPPDEYVVKVAWVARATGEYLPRLDVNGHFTGIETEVARVQIERPISFPSPSTLSIAHPTPAGDEAIAAGVSLLGWSDFAAILRPGELFKLDLFWQAMAVGSLREDALVAFWAQQEAQSPVLLWEGYPVRGGYPFSQWIDGELVVDRYRYALPTDLVAGSYQFWVQVGERQVHLGNFEILALERQFDEPTMQYPLDVSLGDMVRLAGFDLSSEIIRKDEPLELTLYWQSLVVTDLPLKVFVHFVGPDGQVYTQQDWQPRQNSYPVALWIVGEYVDDTYTLVLPEHAPTGVYQVRVGMYLEATGQNLVRSQNGITLEDTWALATVTVR